VGPGKLTNGAPGGAFNVVVSSGSAAIIPAQFGGMTKNQLKPFIGRIEGFIGPNAQVPTFNGVSDVIGPPSGQQNLEANFANDFIIELEGGNDMGVQPITLFVPPEVPCPHGTH
jgi:hypothetical protein